MNSPKYCKHLPRTNEFTGILGKLTKNEWIHQNVGKTYQERKNLSEYWENLPRMNEFSKILGKLTKNEWIYRNIGKTYQERMNWPEYLDYAWPPSPSCPCYPDAVYIIQELIIKVIHHLRIDINFWQLMIDMQCTFRRICLRKSK